MLETIITKEAPGLAYSGRSREQSEGGRRQHREAPAVQSGPTLISALPQSPKERQPTVAPGLFAEQTDTRIATLKSLVVKGTPQSQPRGARGETQSQRV